MLRSFALALFFIFSACSSQQMRWSRGPSAVSSVCNRQSLGLNLADNGPLVQFNNKRTDAVRQLLTTQMEKLKSRVGKEPALSARIEALKKQIQTIDPSVLRGSDEPIEVTWKLNQVLSGYLKDVAEDEKAQILSASEQAKLNEVREKIQPHLSEVGYWMPEFCQNVTGESSKD
jgi:hypothetical protein